MAEEPKATARNGLPGAWGVLLLIVSIVGVILVARLAGPQRILDDHQLLSAEYVNDALANGQWIVMTDVPGNVMSKPPMYTWAAALASLPFGRATYLSLYFTSALAMAGASWLVFLMMRGSLGHRAGLIGSLVFIGCPGVLKHIGTARTDALFALSIALMAYLIWNAWNDRRWWRWLLALGAGSLVILTKGPVGVLLACAGLLAGTRLGGCRIERGAENGKPTRIWPGVALGIVVMLALPGLWLLLAYSVLGDAVIDKMIGQELVGRALAPDGKVNEPSLPPGEAVLLFLRRLFTPSLYVLHIGAPGSVLAAIGCWLAWKQPPKDEKAKRLVRFAFFWFATGLVIFSLAQHQRRDHLLTILPAGAILAGWAIDQIVEGWSARSRLLALWGSVVCIMGASWLYGVVLMPRNHDVIVSEAGAILAREFAPVEARAPGRVLYLRGTGPLQFARGTADSTVSLEEAMDALADGQRVYIATGRRDEELRALATEERVAIFDAAVIVHHERTESIVTNIPLP